MNAAADKLSNLEIVSGLQKEVVDYIGREGLLNRYASGERVVIQGGDGSEVQIILEGTVRVTVYGATGREVMFRDMSVGEPLGIVSAMDCKARSTFAVAQQDTLLLTLSRQLFFELLSSQPQFAVALLRYTAGLVRDLTERMVDLLTINANVRIRQKLLDMASENMLDDTTGEILEPPTHKELANIVASQREVVSREVAALVKKGIVTRSQRRTMLIDVAKLEDALERTR